MPGVSEKFFRRRFFQNHTIVDKSHAVGHLPGKSHFMGDHNERHAGMGQALHDLEHLPDHFRVERRCRFVE